MQLLVLAKQQKVKAWTLYKEFHLLKVLKKKQTEVLMLLESHQSTYTVYQKNIEYLTAAKKSKLSQSHWQHLFADAACVDINDIVTDNDDLLSTCIHYNVINKT